VLETHLTDAAEVKAEVTAEAEEPDFRADRLKERIYLTFTALAVVLALSSRQAEPLEALFTLLVTVLGSLLAILLADLVSHAEHAGTMTLASSLQEGSRVVRSRVQGWFRTSIVLLVSLSLAACTAASAPSATPTASTSGTSTPAVVVKYGQLTPPSVSDSGVLIANAKGWFAEEGINLDLVPFDTAGNMTSPLSTNQIDAGGGSIGAGLFNAVARGVPIVIAADKGTTSAKHGYLGLVVRKALVDGGQFKSMADLKGKKIALSGPAIAPEVALSNLLSAEGMSMSDVDIVQMGFPDMVVAMTNGTIDAAEPIEPFLTDEVTKGAGVLYKRADEYSPDSQNAVVLFSPAFAANTDLATRFMVAYLKGTRLYADAFDKQDASARSDVVSILSQVTSLKDPALYNQVAMPGLAPDGHVNVESLQQQQQYYLSHGQQETQIDMSKVVNASFAASASAQLGPWK
jgi:NitT/TauT family transport system substrate-binding protein